MNKGITKPGTTEAKLLVLLAVQGITISDAEIKSLQALIEYSQNNSLFISAHTSGQIKKDFSLSNSAFSTALHRLENKKLIARDGRTISLNPMFSNLQQLEKLVVSFI